ncbi:MAG: M28 family peptidase [Chloroflexi bacterium]|nr:M28 family peptidase [Chloroflexota bacterium]
MVVGDRGPQAKLVGLLLLLALLVGACLPGPLGDSASRGGAPIPVAALTPRPSPTGRGVGGEGAATAPAPSPPAAPVETAPAASPSVELAPTSTRATDQSSLSIGMSTPTPSVSMPVPAPTASSVVPTGAATVAAPTGRAEFSATRASRHVIELSATIGSRAAGTLGERRAADYLGSQFAAFGYDVERDPFSFRRLEDIGSSVAVPSLARSPLAATALVGSPAARIEAELVSVGLARAADVAGKNLAGKIALIRRGEITFSEKVENVARAGAIGALVFNSVPDPFVGRLQGESRIPALAISGRDGERIAAELTRGTVRATIDAQVEEVERRSENVVARWPVQATDGRGPTVVVGAHFDSVAAGPGANDNASGTAVLLEVARVLAVERRATAVTFVAFGAEEFGLIGSGHYVQARGPSVLANARLMLNLDMVGVGDDMRIGATSPEARRRAVSAIALARELGVTAAIFEARGDSDHTPFAAAGVPAIFITWLPDPQYHTAGDTADRVQSRNLEVTGRAALRLIREALVPAGRGGDGAWVWTTKGTKATKGAKG